MRISIACAAALALGALLAAPAHAESLPGSKHAIAYGQDFAVVSGSGEWQTILAKKIKTANAKGLGLHVSLECGLSTPTFVKSKGDRVESTASAKVLVQVLVDGEVVGAGDYDQRSVTFCSRSKRTTASFAGIFTKPENQTCYFLEEVDTSDPVDGIPDETIVRFDPECLSEEDLELVDDSMSAHSYFFYYDDTSPGAHTIEVQAKIAGDGTERANALLGKGTLLIEEIRLVHGDDGSTLELD
jgi:hypothetical protein